MAHRKNAIRNHQHQLKHIIQSFAKDAVEAGDKMLLARAAFIIQLLGELEEQIKELLKETGHERADRSKD